MFINTCTYRHTYTETHAYIHAYEESTHTHTQVPIDKIVEREIIVQMRDGRPEILQQVPVYVYVYVYAYMYICILIRQTFEQLR